MLHSYPNCHWQMRFLKKHQRVSSVWSDNEKKWIDITESIVSLSILFMLSNMILIWLIRKTKGPKVISKKIYSCKGILMKPFKNTSKITTYRFSTCLKEYSRLELCCHSRYINKCFTYTLVTFQCFTNKRRRQRLSHFANFQLSILCSCKDHSNNLYTK